MNALLKWISGVVACTVILPSVPALAQESASRVLSDCGAITYTAGRVELNTQTTKGLRCGQGSVPPPTPSTITGTTSAATVTSASTQLLAAAPRTLLSIDNESTTATIACRFGGTAAINTAGSFTIPPGFTRTWLSYPVPTDVVNCISSAATSPATVEVF